MDILHKCKKCGKYTISRICCGRGTINPHPPRFDPKDRHGKYRRKAKGIE
ncbi:MAG: nucleolar RNA-binding Nop10p family protein [Candidatus Micrarchaeota archaeon]